LAAGTNDEVTLVLKSARESLSGTVLDAGGEPVAGAWVNCSGVGQAVRLGMGQVITDKDGRFSIQSLIPGSIYLSAEKHDAESSRDITVNYPDDEIREFIAKSGIIVSYGNDWEKGSAMAMAEIEKE